MDEREARLREHIRRKIREYLEEMSTTGGVAGYLTPGAFVGDKHSNKKKIEKGAKSIGYTLTDKGAKDTGPGDTLKEETMVGARGGVVDRISFSSINSNAFRGNKPANMKKIEELSSIHEYTMTEKGKEHHSRPADHHDDARRPTKALDSLSIRGEYTPLNKEDLEATKAHKTHTVVRSITERLVTSKKILNRLNENYYAYRNDTTKLPHQKIGHAISALNRDFKLIERALRMNSRLKKESGVANDMLWKRTKAQMAKMEGRLMELARQLREMRG